MKTIISFTLVALVAVCSGQTANYCDSSLCPPKTTHIACNGLKTIDTQVCGAGAFEVAMNSTNQELILHVHNQLRSKVATGQQANRAAAKFNQASRMGTLQWDAELASIAAANARRCVYGHDQCRNTAVYKMAGQNIAIKMYYGKTFTDNQLITGFINDWYNEAENATIAILAGYPKSYTGPAIGHFTQIVSDRTTKVGCAMVSFIRSPFTQKYFVCNYGFTNLQESPVYVSGTACSKCTSGCNSKYPGLCNVAENIKNGI
ncbi:venom allergen 5 [Aedes aegypti]|uniref:Venom allergen-1 n=1 Tax=Aedes aegypti TaxID=7159 RepID=A0A903U7Y2_AEDAE|nr:venom allergen 5 [Aedes aegypti]